MADRQSFKKLALARLRSSKLLYKYKDYDAAGYLIGYVVEFALKATICKTLNLTTYPGSGEKHFEVFATHNVDRLLILSGLSSEIDINKNRELFTNWSVLTSDWGPEVRYELSKYDKIKIENKLKALEDKPNGFLAWIKGGKKW